MATRVDERADSHVPGDDGQLPKAGARRPPDAPPAAPEGWWRIRAWILPELVMIESAEHRRRLWPKIQGEVAYLFMTCAMGLPVLVWASVTGWSKLGGPSPAALLSLSVAFWLPFLIGRGHLRGIVREPMRCEVASWVIHNVPTEIWLHLDIRVGEY